MGRDATIRRKRREAREAFAMPPAARTEAQRELVERLLAGVEKRDPESQALVTWALSAGR